MGITDTQQSDIEIVLQERVVSSDYRIVEIHEFIKNRQVNVKVELGPFVTETRGPEGNPQTETIATGGSRSVTVWRDDEYDAIRDTWTNADLMTAVKTKLV